MKTQKLMEAIKKTIRVIIKTFLIITLIITFQWISSCYGIFRNVFTKDFITNEKYRATYFTVCKNINILFQRLWFVVADDNEIYVQIINNDICQLVDVDFGEAADLYNYTLMFKIYDELWEEEKQISVSVGEKRKTYAYFNSKLSIDYNYDIEQLSLCQLLNIALTRADLKELYISTVHSSDYEIIIPEENTTVTHISWLYIGDATDVIGKFRGLQSLNLNIPESVDSEGNIIQSYDGTFLNDLSHLEIILLQTYDISKIDFDGVKNESAKKVYLCLGCEPNDEEKSALKSVFPNAEIKFITKEFSNYFSGSVDWNEIEKDDEWIVIE